MMNDGMSANLATGRAKRATAGNRMHILLTNEFQSEELFMEEDGDEEFFADEVDDVFDDDFQDTDEDEDQNEGGEQWLQAEEREQRSTLRHRARHILSKPRINLRLTSGAKNHLSKRTGDPGGGIRTYIPGDALSTRTSKRVTTMLRSQEVQLRLDNFNQRRATTFKRPKVRYVAKTQDTLIREALELEEQNTASLRDLLNREEAKKKLARVVRTKQEGPHFRWVSRAEGTLDVPQDQPAVSLYTNTLNCESNLSSSAEPPPRTHPHLAPSAIPQGCEQSGNLPKIPAESVQRSDAGEHLQGNILTLLQSSDEASHFISQVKMDTDTRDLKQLYISDVSHKLHNNLQSVNYLVLRASRKVTHTELTSMPFGCMLYGVPAGVTVLERPNKDLLNPLCAVSGAPAKYLDPKTGLPYASSRCYQIISKLSHHDYVWSQASACYMNDQECVGASGAPTNWAAASQHGGNGVALVCKPSQYLAEQVDGRKDLRFACPHAAT